MFERINVGDRRVNIVLKKDRKVTSSEFERGLSPALAAIPGRPRQLPGPERRRTGWRMRDIMLYLGGDDPEELTAVADQMKKLKRPGPSCPASRKRPPPSRNPDQAPVRPCRQPGGDDGRAQPDHPDRDAGRNRAEQREILAVGPAGPDPFRCRNEDRRDLATSRTSRADIERRSVPFKVVSDIGFGSGPTKSTDQTRNGNLSSAPISPGCAERRVTGQGRCASDNEEPAVGRPEARSATKWQNEMLFNFLIALISGVLLVFAVLVLLYRRACRRS